MRVLVQNYSFNKVSKQITFTDYTSINLENVLLVLDVTNNATIYQANDPSKGGSVSGNVLILDFDTNTASFDNSDDLQIFYEPELSSSFGTVNVAFSSAQASSVPAPRGSQGLITIPAPQNLFRTTFSAAISSGVNSDFFSLVQSGTGQTVSQTGGNLVLASGTSARSETIIRSKSFFIGPMLARVQTILSQRIANNNFFVELVDVIGDSLAVTVNSATSITVTIPANPFTSANIGQSMYVGAVQNIANAVPGRYAIASVSGNDVTFTVASWPTSGSGTCSLFGWNYYQLLYTGTSATSASYDAQRNGYNSGFTAATVNTTATGHLAILANNDGNAYFADQLVTSAAGLQVTQRASRSINLANESANLYLQIRAVNGSTAPASSTTWTIGTVSVENYTPTSVVINDVKAQGLANQMPVAVTNTPAVTVSSGTVTTVSSVTSANLAIPGIVADVASAALTTTTTTATITPGSGIAYSVNIPVTAVSGTDPILDVSIEESDNTGTNWFKVYDFPRINAVGIYRSPVLRLRGNRIRYVQTVGGVSPSFTRSINRLQSSNSGNLMAQFINRTIDPNTLGSVSPVYFIDAMTDVSVTARCTAQVAAAQIAIEFSDDGINWIRNSRTLTTANGFSAPLEVAPHWKFLRLITVSAGSGIVLGEITIKAGDVTTVDLATEVTLQSIDSKLPALSGGRMPVDIGGAGSITITSGTVTVQNEVEITNDNGNPIPVTGTVTANTGLSQPITDAQLRASAVAVSATSLPLPSGAATEAKQDTANSSLSSIDGKLPSLASGRIPVDIGGTGSITVTSGTITVQNEVEITNDTGNPIPVSGTVTANTGLSQPLTDTQLRASAVAVSGPLTDAQLRASSVPVSISDTIDVSTGLSQPLTDAQLRASAIAISATDLDIRNLTSSDVITVTGGAAQSADVKVTLDNEQVSVSNFPTNQQVSGTVSIASGDLYIAGQAAQTATVNNILTSTAGSAAIDVSNYRFGSVQVVSTTFEQDPPLQSMQLVFEGSNDNVNFFNIPVSFESASAGTTNKKIVGPWIPNIGSRLFAFPINFKYLRLRVVTPSLQGDVQAFTRLSPVPSVLTNQIVSTDFIDPIRATFTNTAITANAGSGTFAVSAASLPLPSGAATSAAQTNGSQKTQIADGSGNIISSTNNALDVNLKTPTLSVIDLLDENILNTSSINIPGSSSSPVQVVASLASSVKALQFMDTTGAFVGIYTGASGSEVLRLIMGPGSDKTVEHNIVAGTRISLKRLDSASPISSGILAINFLG